MNGSVHNFITLPEPRGIAHRKADKSGYIAPACGTLPSVTRILGATSSSKERLEKWLKRPDAQSISDAAKARGTWTHGVIEDWINAHSAGTSRPDPKHFAFGSYWRSIKPWLESYWTHAVALEQPVYHTAGFAGSFDAIGYSTYGDQPGAFTLFDWKTSKHRRDEELVEDYFCQLGAYVKAIHYVYGITPERALLVIARPTCAPDVWELSSDDLAAAYERFSKRLNQFYSMPQET